jgi:antitoxin ParD1/3/4
MAAIEKISVALPADMLELVKRAVRTGDYATTSEVVREALREWKVRRETRAEAVSELRRLWKDGVDSGGWRPFDAEEIRREGRRRLERPKPTKTRKDR